MKRSRWLRAAAESLMSSWPGPGVGLGTSLSWRLEMFVSVAQKRGVIFLTGTTPVPASPRSSSL